MVSIRGLFLLLETTKNFWVILKLKNSPGKRKIIFRKGCTLVIDWREYQIIRSMLSKGYTINGNENFLYFQKGTMKIALPLKFIKILGESLEEDYKCDCKDKIVLDVGGFIGETAVLFAAWGAKKVIIYEPVVSNQEFIQNNMNLNGINAELHDEGIGDHNGITIIHYDAIDASFGLNDVGTNEMEIKIKDATDIIEESGASIAKFDCEGAEKYLLGVPVDTLRKIELYMIEAHNEEIRNLLIDKFKESGFNLIKNSGSNMLVLSFKRVA